MRARARTAAATIGVLLITEADALARGGSGSSHFGGFGGGGRSGGGGFGGSGFGHGHFFFLPIGGGGGGILLTLIVLFLIARFVLPPLLRWWRGQQQTGMQSARRVAERERRVELAAAEASEDDPAFAPDNVRPAAAKLFLDIQSAWDRGDRITLRGLVAPDLLREWELRLDDFDRKGWRNRVEPLGEPKVDYIGLVNRAGDEGDRVAVRIDARLKDYVVDSYGSPVSRNDAVGQSTRVREYWTLAKRDSHWILYSIEQGAEGSHALTDDVIASPWSDEKSMRDEALLEGAVADAVPDGTKISEVADLDYDGDARAAANDLSLADGRFAPDVLEVSARRAAAAWADAVDGDDTTLQNIAHPDAVEALLHPGDPSARSRVVVRGATVKRISIAALDAAAEPPSMTIDVTLHGARYVEDRNTLEVLEGSRNHAVDFTVRWVMRLDGPDTEPWRIASVGSIAGRT